MTTYLATIGYWNGASYELIDAGTEHDTLDAAKASVEDFGDLTTDADGEECDVDVELCVYEVDDDGETGNCVYRRVHQSGVNQRAQEAVEEEGTIIATATTEWDTTTWATRPAIYGRSIQFVRWTNNGGSRGAHQGDQNHPTNYEDFGEIETPDFPEWMESLIGSVGETEAQDLIDSDWLDGTDDYDVNVYQWNDVAGNTYEIDARWIDCGCYRVVWTYAREAGGVDDIEIIDADSDIDEWIVDHVPGDIVEKESA